MQHWKPGDLLSEADRVLLQPMIEKSYELGTQRSAIRELFEYGNRRRAAEELNISQRTLYRRIKEYGLE